MSDEIPDWLPDDEEPKETGSALVEAPTGRTLSKAEQVSTELRGMEDTTLRASLLAVGGAIDFIHLDPADPAKVPPEWIEELGPKEATLRHRAAMAGMMSAKEAPVGLKLAAQMVTGIVKARSAEQANTGGLNIGTVVFMHEVDEDMSEYIEVEVDE